MDSVADDSEDEKYPRYRKYKKGQAIGPCAGTTQQGGSVGDVAALIQGYCAVLDLGTELKSF